MSAIHFTYTLTMKIRKEEQQTANIGLATCRQGRYGG
jgi:hypothetical protein